MLRKINFLAGHLWKDIYSRLEEMRKKVFDINKKLKEGTVTKEDVDVIYSYLDSKYDDEVAVKKKSIFSSKNKYKLDRKMGTVDGLITKFFIPFDEIRLI